MSRTQKVATHLPCLKTRAAQLFPKAWALLPTHAKVLTAMAAAAGVTVVHSDGMWVWGGTEAQLRASGVFKTSQDWSFDTHVTADTGEGIRAVLWRIPGDDQIGARMRFDVCGRRSCERFAMMAAADAAFQSFRIKALAPIPLADAPALEEDDGGWQGPIPLALTSATAANFKRRGVFPMLTGAGEWQVSVSIARAVLRDAGGQPGQAMAALRKRIAAALRAYECSGGKV